MNKFCVTCGVSVPHNAHCPLCGRLVNDGMPEAERYPEAADKRSVSRNVLRFIAIAAALVAASVDFITGGSFRWSAIVAASLVCVWFLVFRPVFYSRPFGNFLVADVLALWAASLGVDVCYGFTRWSITFVWPAVVGAGITAVLFCSLFGRLKWSVVGTALVVFAALCVIMLPLGFFGVYPNTKLWLILGLYAALCIFGLKYFLRRRFDEKLRGLFHV